MDAITGGINAGEPAVQAKKASSEPVPPCAAQSEPQQGDFFHSLTWSGEVPAQKWMNFYTKVLAKHAGTAWKAVRRDRQGCLSSGQGCPRL